MPSVRRRYSCPFGYRSHLYVKTAMATITKSLMHYSCERGNIFCGICTILYEKEIDYLHSIHKNKIKIVICFQNQNFGFIFLIDCYIRYTIVTLEVLKHFPLCDLYCNIYIYIFYESCVQFCN